MINRLVIAVALLFLVVIPVAAHDETPSHSEESTPSESTTSAVTTINTFEAFWPLSAGKTRDNNLYILKIWKENLRGLLIFGAPQKADYQALRATKRMLEAESLIVGGKKDQATKTVESSNQLLENANNTLADVETIPEDVNVNIKNRLDNLIKLVDSLRASTDGSLHEQLDLNHTKIEQVLERLSKN